MSLPYHFPWTYSWTQSWPYINICRDPTLRTCWGYTFRLTDSHMSISQSDQLKQSCDSLADRAYTILASLPSVAQKDVPDKTPSEHPPIQSDALVENKVLVPESQNAPSDNADASSSPQQLEPASDSKPKMKRDLFAILKANASADPVLTDLWEQVNTVPPWVDWEQISRGQDVFYRYGGPALMGLAFQSLLGGMGAGRVVETLSRTGGFSTRVARHRLLETTQHILQCTKSLPSIKPGGDGFASSVRVRLLHAAVRTSIMDLAKRDPNYYDVATLGIPVNDLDCIATIVTFSSSLIFISFPRQGIFLSRREIEDYIALWRYIAYLTGTPDEDFSTPERARQAMETLMLYEINPTETSQILAHNVIEALALQPPNYPSREFLEAFARWLNGSALCDALGLGRPSLYYWALVAGQVVFSWWMIHTTTAIASLDRKKITFLRKIFWDIIVENKEGLGSETLFDYKYIPRIGKLTKPTKGSRHANAQDRIEKRNLTVFVGTSILAVSVTLILLKALPAAALSLKHMAMMVGQRT